MISIRIGVRRRICIGVRAVGFEVSLQALSMQQACFDPIEGVPSLHRLDGLAKRFEKVPTGRRTGACRRHLR